MKIKNLAIKSIEIPFKQSFSHTSNTRTVTEAVLVQASSVSGALGLGEGCPRSYVTGEDVLSAISFFEKHKSKFLKVESIEDIKFLVESLKLEIDDNPAAFCAVEMALWGLCSNEFNQSVEQLLNVSEDKKSFQYTAVLGISSHFKKMASQYHALGFSDFKIKLSSDLEEDQSNINFLKNLYNSKCRIRLDANNLWSDPITAADYINDLKSDFFGLEEPMQPFDYEGMTKLFDLIQTKIILDESFKTEADFERLIKPENWIINVRVSKMGGILRSLEIVKKAKLLSVPVIIGAQVGETSLLTRAALVIARASGSNLIAQEGAFGTHLLNYDLVDPPLQFGKSGILQLA